MQSCSIVIMVILAFAFADHSFPKNSYLDEYDEDEFDLKHPPCVCNYDENGCIQGIYMPGIETKFYEAFLGIPFAKPPVNNLRFANPKPFDVWQTNIIADTEKEMCIQQNYLLVGEPVFGSEDCLYLNIYRPIHAKHSLKPLPVIVYIFGGGYFSGSAGPSFHGGQYFMDTGEVIMVAISYRLGAFGFLSTGDKYMPGNFGLKDQTLALKWINKNIKYFNGNPDLVTIFGQSAGAASVHFHMLSKLSTGLFHRAGLISGTALAPFNGPEINPLKVTRKFAKYLKISNYKTLSAEGLAKKLKKVDATAILESSRLFKKISINPVVNFKIVIEDERDPNSFITKDPQQLMELGEMNYVPLFASIVDEEGFVVVGKIVINETMLNKISENLNYYLPNILMLKEKPGKSMTQLINDIVRYYFEGSTKIDEKNKNGLVQALGDYFFVQPYYNTIKLYTKHMPPGTPVNLFNFSYKGINSYSSIFSGSSEDFGVIHCDDLMYYFNMPALFPAFEAKSPEALFSAAFVQSFTKFAKTGVPEKWVTVDNCKFDEKNPEQLCNYQRIIREGDSFNVKLENSYDYKMLKFWD